MATINYRLQKLAEELFIKSGSKEREYINGKIENFKINIKQYFGNQVDEILVFGSFSCTGLKTVYSRSMYFC